MNIRLLVAIIAIWISSGTHCFAIQLPGDDDADFLEFVEGWLQGEDVTSLNGFAKLAADGNVAARLLLARIERYDRSPSTSLSNLDRDKRLSLFRSKIGEGPFYRSWIDVEARLGNPVAQALRATGYPEVNIDLIEYLISIGEFEATDHPVRIASLYGSASQRRYILDNKLVLDEMIPYVLSFKENPQRYSDGIEALRYIAKNFGQDKNLTLDDQDTATQQAALFLALGLPYGDLKPDNPWLSAITLWMQRSDGLRPVAEICSEKCPDEAQICSLMLIGLTGGYYEAVRLDSPLESVITQTRYLNSPRARRIALRRASLTRSEFGKELLSLQEISARSECTSKLVEEQRADRPAWDQ